MLERFDIAFKIEGQDALLSVACFIIEYATLLEKTSRLVSH